MGRRSYDYRMVQALDDERKLSQLDALGKIGTNSQPDLTAQIPGTGPEKLVYNYLVRLGIRFQFQYHQEDFESTATNEELYIPDFTLPDYNYKIEIFGEYWHSIVLQRESDLRKWARQLYGGYMIIEHGIPTFPESGGCIGKYIIWWSQEVYFDLAFLFSRDLPELFSIDRIKGVPDEYILDAKEERRAKKARDAGMAARRLKPKVNPIKRELRRLKTKRKDLTKIYPILRKMKEEATFRIPKGIYETRGRKKSKY